MDVQVTNNEITSTLTLIVAWKRPIHWHSCTSTNIHNVAFIMNYVIQNNTKQESKFVNSNWIE